MLPYNQTYPLFFPVQYLEAVISSQLFIPCNTDSLTCIHNLHLTLQKTSPHNQRVTWSLIYGTKCKESILKPYVRSKHRKLLSHKITQIYKNMCMYSWAPHFFHKSQSTCVSEKVIGHVTTQEIKAFIKMSYGVNTEEAFRALFLNTVNTTTLTLRVNFEKWKLNDEFGSGGSCPNICKVYNFSCDSLIIRS